MQIITIINKYIKHQRNVCLILTYAQPKFLKFPKLIIPKQYHTKDVKESISTWTLTQGQGIDYKENSIFK